MSVKQHIEKAEEFKERGEEEIKIAVDHLEKAVQNFRIAAYHYEAALAAENVIDPKAVSYTHLTLPTTERV